MEKSPKYGFDNADQPILVGHTDSMRKALYSGRPRSSWKVDSTPKRRDWNSAISLQIVPCRLERPTKCAAQRECETRKLLRLHLKGTVPFAAPGAEPPSAGPVTMNHQYRNTSCGVGDYRLGPPPAKHHDIDYTDGDPHHLYGLLPYPALSTDSVTRPLQPASRIAWRQLK